MKVCIFADYGVVIWWRNSEPPSGFTAADYLHGALQQKIIATLVDALTETRR